MRVSIGLGLIASLTVLACTVTRTETLPGAGAGEAGESGDPEASVDATEPEKPRTTIVPNLTITDVAVFQAVKVPVVKGGVIVKRTKRNAPVVARRPALVRVYVKPGSGWEARSVTAELQLVAGDETFPIVRETKTVREASTDADVESTFNLEVPAESLPPGVAFQVALTADDGEAVAEGEPSAGRFPADGALQDLGVEVSGKLKVVVVPVKYEADGSGRTPDVSTAQLARYQRTLMARYPASEVEVKARAPFAWSQRIAGNGTGFTSILRAMHALREDDGADDDVYYYGLLAPTSTMSAFCQGGCVAGLSTVADEDTPMLRASVGLGYVGESSAETMAHEIGHAHGREHAPCGGAAGVDPDYPYPQAQIGVWGYDIFAKTFIPPTRGRDMMGYCPNEWVSDYTYGALFDRIASVSMAKHVTHVSSVPSERTRWQIAIVGPAGELDWRGAPEVGSAIDLGRHGTSSVARYLGSDGREIASREARFVRFDHLPGGFLFVPRATDITWTKVRVDGYQDALIRP